ncbi:MAG: radical SAM protein [Thermoleophilia bacterium]|nr:radical SAM protein [Thermoleophilia bacterium]
MKRADLHSNSASVRLAGRLVRARLLGRPLMLSHLVTRRCNARCATCLWRADADPTGVAQAQELSPEEALWLYHEAAREGFPLVVIWGGEPLLRPDLPLLVRAAQEGGMAVALITNGWFLPERWPELRGWVRTLIVSLDEVGERHDQLRGLPGLYERLDGFLSTLLRDPLRPRVLVNTVLSRLNRGALRRIAQVARRWEASMYFCAMETGFLLRDGFRGVKQSLALSPTELREAARLARELKLAGYPVLVTDRYLALLERDPHLSAYRCQFPKAVLTVEADGSLRDCTCRDQALANVRQAKQQGTALIGLMRTHGYRAMLERARSCTTCNNPDVIETSWYWDMKPFMLCQGLNLARIGHGRATQ